jgi:tetratricopeptide (TPR) repeat protein
MPLSEDHLNRLLSAWRKALAEGQDLSIQELCRDCPDLIEEVKRRPEFARQLEDLPPGPKPTLPQPNTSIDRVEPPTLPPADRAGMATLPYRSVDTVSTSGPLVSPTGSSRYRIVRPFARGGLGEVFLAHDEELDREVALKEIQAPFANDMESRARFVREGKVTGGLEHPGIVPVYGLGAYIDGRPFYAMRFIKGESLRDAIGRFHQADRRGRDFGERALALRELLRRFIDVCNAIEYAHSREVLHRDLKPANVMLGPYGETLVVDWGLAKAFGQPDGNARLQWATSSAPAGSGAGATQAGTVIGTPAYMSPEQAAGKLEELGPAADVYSLGAMLYCLLTGKAPIEDPDVLLTLVRAQTGEFPTPRQVKRNVPIALEAICLKAMKLQPEQRYASARALADDLEHWLADEPIAAHRESLWERTRRLCRHRPVYAALLGFVAAMDLSICGLLIAIFLGKSALAFLPFALFGGVVGASLGVLFLAQVWWLLGALAGALFASRGTRSGGLIGLVVGGLIAWVSLATSRVYLIPGTAAVPPFGFVILPLAGAAVGILLGAFVVPLYTRTKKRTLLIALLGSALGFVIGSLVTAWFALDAGAASFEPVLNKTLIGALIGVAIGAVLGTYPGNAKRAAIGTSLGALLGAILGAMLMLFADKIDASYTHLNTAIFVGGLSGAALGALVVACRGEGRKKVLHSGFLGGRIGLAGGTLLFGLLIVISTQRFSVSALTLFAVVVLLTPPVLDFGFGWMRKASWDGLLTRTTRGAVIGSVLGWSTAVTLLMADLSQLSNTSGTQAAKATASVAGVPSAKAGQMPPAGVNPGTKDPFEAIIPMFEKLARDNPGNAEHAITLGTAYSNQAKFTRDGKSLEKALLQYNQAIATLQPVTEKEPRHLKAREALRDSFAGRAETLARLNRSAESLAEWDHALALDTWPNRNEIRLQRAVALARLGEHIQATKECDALAEVKNLSAATLYALSQAYARSAGALQADPPLGPPLPPADQQKLRERYAARSVAFLVEAEAAGYFRVPGNLDALKESADFASLRSRDDFKRLLARRAPPSAPRKAP